MDKRWRRKVARELKGSQPHGVRVLDVACGTGDLSLTLFEVMGARVTGADFCRPMLTIAAEKSRQAGAAIPFIEADALALPFGNGSFDVVTIAFGLRNLASVDDGLRELCRVLKPGGQAAILEFSSPRVPGFRTGFKLYFTKLLPLLGGVVSGSRSAYEYLPDSVSRFPDQKRLAALMGDAGFAEVRFLNLTGGVAALHFGTKPKLVS